MFTSTVVRRAASPYLVFIRRSYKNAALKKQLSPLTVGKRGKLLGKLWKTLPKAEKAKIVAEAKKTKLKKRRVVRRKPTPFSLFVKSQIKSADIKSLPARQRFGAIAKKWAQQ